MPVAGLPGIPVRYTGIGLDAQMIEAFMQVGDGLAHPVAPGKRRPVRQGPLPTVPEQDFAGRGPLAAEAAFVYEAVVLAAKLHEVVQAGLAALAPVLDVMRIDEMPAGASREAAAVVSQA